MTTQHTPGPWRNARQADGRCVCFQVAPQPPTEHYVEPVNEEYRANMRLLDAAPDLLAAAELAAATLNLQAGKQARLRARTALLNAIAIATGAAQ
jgi:hypothetical protein